MKPGLWNCNTTSSTDQKGERERGMIHEKRYSGDGKRMKENRGSDRK
jgi:hypothetical protein